MELAIKIKQHTPIIHFQWEQSGATLRATELKPKLDRYIRDLKKYYSKSWLEEINVLSNNDNDDRKEIYQLTISQSSIKEIVIPKILDKKTKNSGKYDLIETINSNPNKKQKLRRSLYFGDVKAMLLYSDDIILRFQSFSIKAIKKICIALPIMLAMENFGSRQNKGFGSFYINEFHKIPDGLNSIKSTDFMDIESIYNILKNTTVYYFDCNGDYVEVFKQIFYFYNTLKSGINEGKNKYSKSLLWQYLRNKNPGLIWEKRIMKQCLIGDTLSSPLPNNYQFIRVLLGLSPIYEFKKTYDKNGKNHPARMDKDYCDKRTLSIKEDVKFSVNDTESDEEKKIDRVTSPLTFKPISTNSGYRIYIILKPETIECINNHKFSFNEKNRGIEFKIQPPSYFNLEEFMDFARDRIKIDKIFKLHKGSV